MLDTYANTGIKWTCDADDADVVVQTVTTGALCTTIVTTNGWDNTADSKVGDNGFNGNCNTATNAGGTAMVAAASNGGTWALSIHTGTGTGQKYHSYNFKDPGCKGR